MSTTDEQIVQFAGAYGTFSLTIDCPSPFWFQDCPRILLGMTHGHARPDTNSGVIHDDDGSVVGSWEYRPRYVELEKRTPIERFEIAMKIAAKYIPKEELPAFCDGINAAQDLAVPQ